MRIVLAIARCSLLICIASTITASSAIAETESDASTLSSLSETFWRPLILHSSQPSADITVYFHDDLIEIASPCSFAGLAFRATPNNIRFSNEYSSSGTNRANCKTLQPAFDAFVGRIKQAKEIRLRDDTLDLLDENGEKLTQLLPNRATEIEQRWLNIVAYSDGGTLVTARPLGNFVPKLLLFGGQIEGTLGCGDVDGWYIAKRSFITLSASDFIFGGCANNEDAAAHQNTLIEKQLNSAASLRTLRDGHFALLDKQGHIRAELSAGSTPP